MTGIAGQLPEAAASAGIAPWLQLAGAVVAAALAAWGGQWWTARTERRRAASPAGQAEAEAIAVRAELDREKWLDDRTEQLIANLERTLENTTRRAEELEHKVDIAEGKVNALAAELDTLRRVLRETELERDHWRAAATGGPPS